MPARDLHHKAVKTALIKDGWRILAEDYTLWYDRDRLYVDVQREVIVQWID
jgi:hypothetical protein